jgi:hydrogenase maturation protease
MNDLRQQLDSLLAGRVCLIGVGNPDYGDDGAGMLLARRLLACLTQPAVRNSSFGSQTDPSQRHASARRTDTGGTESTSSVFCDLQGHPLCRSSRGEEAHFFCWMSNSAERVSLVTSAATGWWERVGAAGNACVFLAETSPERYVSRLVEGGFDHVIFIDAVHFGAEPGAVALLDSTEMRSRYPQVSTHKISLGVLAQLVEEAGRTRAWLLGVQPGSLRPGRGLSTEVRTTLNLLVALLGDRLEIEPKEEWVAA